MDEEYWLFCKEQEQEKRDAKLAEELALAMNAAPWQKWVRDEAWAREVCRG